MQLEKAIRLKKLREEHGYTQEWVGQNLGLSQPGYSRIESGGAKLTEDIICKMAQLYGVSADYILGREDINNETK